MNRTVLLIDQDGSPQEPDVRTLRDYGCEVSVVRSVAEALAELRNRRFDTALVDLRLASMGAGNLLALLRKEQAEINVMLMVNGGFHAPQDQPLKLAGYSLLTKPLTVPELERLLPAPREEVTRETAAPRPEDDINSTGFGALVGNSAKMQKVRYLISKLAAQRHPVLILGESGTGKELVAKAIHVQGPWRDQPFVPVDCGALSPTLIESELFGHVKGAFTGANQSKVGLLAAAGKGTVFLDEIGELPIELQPRLLRALQEREIKPLGSNERVRLEARMLAATNQDLEAAIKRGAFRQDLYYRLNVVALRVPPLRDRKEDIPLLVAHFLKRFANGEPPMRIPDKIMGCLMAYAWPGNVRDLENSIQRAVSLGSGSYIQTKDLPTRLLYSVGAAAALQKGATTLESMEREAIRMALESVGGDRVRAAQLLGIGKTTIYRKVKEYGLEPLASSDPEP